jgi:hypothetical protein
MHTQAESKWAERKNTDKMDPQADLADIRGAGGQGPAPLHGYPRAKHRHALDDGHKVAQELVERAPRERSAQHNPRAARLERPTRGAIIVGIEVEVLCCGTRGRGM